MYGHDLCAYLSTETFHALQVVICGIFSPLDNSGQQEGRAALIVRHCLGDKVNVVCSRDGRLTHLHTRSAKRYL